MMQIFPNSDSARESGKKAPPPKKTDTGIAGKDSTGKVNDVLTRLNNTLVKALANGVTTVDGKELDHGQAEELRHMMGLGYNLVPVSVESLSHVAKGGDEMWGRGWDPDVTSRVTFQASDNTGQPAGSYGLTLTKGKGQTTRGQKPKPAPKKTAAKQEANTAGSFGFLLRSGMTSRRRKS